MRVGEAIPKNSVIIFIVLELINWINMICPKCGTRLPPKITKCHFCGNEVFCENAIVCRNEITYTDKFIALFTVLALSIAISAFFYTYLAEFENPNRAMGSLFFGFLAGLFYLVISSYLVRHLIDPMLK